MKQNKNPLGFLIGALLLGVFWGLLSQWGAKSESTPDAQKAASEEKTVAPTPPKIVYLVDLAQKYSMIMAII